MNTAFALAVLVAVIGIAAAVFFYKRYREVEAQKEEIEAEVMDWIESNTYLKASAFTSFKALFRAARYR